MKRKFTLFLFALITSLGAWATSYTITYGTTTGSFYDGSGNAVTSGWVAKWVSNEVGKPKVTLTASANNINAANARLAPGSSESCTYTLYVEGGYKVTGFSMNCPTSGAAVTVTPAGESAVAVGTGETLVVNSSAASFVYSGSNSGRIQAGSNDSGSFTITVEEEDWAPSIAGHFLTVGDKVASITAASAADDNDHWYILTQIRGGETPMYNTRAATEQLRRASAPFTLSSLDGNLTSTNSAYLIRFKSVGEGTYNIQFANGYWIDGNLKAANFNTAGTYAFYNCNSGSGSYFAWNLSSKSGSKVDNNGAGNTVSFWESGETTGTSGNNVWYIYETTVYVPASTVDVTYAQYVDGVATGTTFVETVLPNSAINVPSSFYTGYSSLAYDYSTTGTIAEEDVTIRVNIDKKTGVTLPAGLSNSKKYQLICERGGLSTYYDEANSRTALASPVKTELSVSAKDFAILNYDSKYYLYSVSDEQFVTYQSAQIAPLADMVTGTSDAIAFSQTTNSVFVIRFDNDANKNINSSSAYTYGIVINDWGSQESDWDGGCQYIIKEVDDFDATTPLAVLEYSIKIAQLKAINWGLTASGNNGKPNYYNFIGAYAGYAGNEMSIIESLESAGYSAERLTTVQGMLDNYALNLPSAGFYRFKSNATGKYIGFAESGKQPMVESASAGIYYYTAGKQFVNYNQGRYLSGAVGNAVTAVGTAGPAFNFYESGYSNKTPGTYRIRVAGDASGSLIDWTDDYLNGWGAGDHARCEWIIEEVTSLPISISAAGYATLYSPVALSIPSGITVYKATENGEYLTLTAVASEAGDVIPANQGFIIAGAEGSYNFTVTTGGSVDGNVLTGTVAAISRPDGSYILATGDSGVGFYQDGASTIPGFKAYYQPESPVKDFMGFFFEDDETAIENVNVNDDLNLDNSAIYNIAGQRLQKMQKGINIINGRKVVLK